jgi:hypothetical protein
MHIIWQQYLQLFSLLLAVLYNKGLKQFKLTAFIPLLIIVCITEFIGSNKVYFGWKTNYLVYDIYMIVSFPVTYYIFQKMLSYNGGLKTAYYYIGVLIWMFFLTNLFFIQGLQSFNTYSLILTEFVFIMISLFVLMRLFKDDDFNIMLYNHPYFWISGGTLIFSIGTLIILGLQQIIVKNNLQIDGKYIYRILLAILNVALYASYSYAFYLCRKLTSK